MTRVEKYHRYREEIANMKVDDNSSKKLTSSKVDLLRSNSSSSRLDYSQINEVYSINSKKSTKTKLLFILIIGGLLLILLIVLLIVLL